MAEDHEAMLVQAGRSRGDTLSIAVSHTRCSDGLPALVNDHDYLGACVYALALKVFIILVT
jgi:hypothetical protein